MRLPAHAYVPGRNERHPEGAFDAIRETAAPGMDAEALACSDAFRHGLRYIESGHYWEAHEVLEPVWMALPEGGNRDFVQGLIQLANGLLKLRMERPRAALRLAKIARDLMPDTETAMGVPVGMIHDRIDTLERAAKNAS